ncbi:MAG: carbohydrate ABC transporter substrate-binding protein [Candidatus Sericytochromatia bacterium]|nr:carbohydrate ABC transporter substrate-binding protein [Candidatus Sericytochromatia bacterium]
MRRRAVRLAGLTLGILGLFQVTGCQDATQVEWWISVPPAAETVFRTKVEAFNKAHPGQVVTLLNVPAGQVPDQLQTRLAKGQAPTFVTLSHHQIGDFPPDTFGSWGSKVAPAIRQDIFGALWDHPAGSDSAWCIPLWMQHHFTADNTTMLEKGGVIRIPVSLGEIVSQGKLFQATTGHQLWMPPFGDPDYAMSVFDQQGVALVNRKMEPQFHSGAAVQALGWWVQQFADGVFPKESLDLTTSQAVARFQAGDVAMVSVLPKDILTLKDSTHLKLRNLGASRDISGESESVRSIVYGLYHPQKAPLGMVGQNLVAFLQQPKVNLDIADAMNSLPVNGKTFAAGDFGAAAGGDVLFAFNRVGAAFVDKTTTTVGGLRQRALIAKAVRSAFLAACRDGKPADVALTEAAAMYTREAAPLKGANP